MKTALLAFSILLAWSAWAQDSIPFAEFFVDSTLRIDYYHAGSKTEEFITLDRLYRQGVWGGSTHHLLDPFNLGRYA
ncbi:MAG TPA: peptidase M64 N-terminal domain-containing protein, partial [Bacteroidota bacterium]